MESEPRIFLVFRSKASGEIIQYNAVPLHRLRNTVVQNPKIFKVNMRQTLADERKYVEPFLSASITGIRYPISDYDKVNEAWCN